MAISKVTKSWKVCKLTKNLINWSQSVTSNTKKLFQWQLPPYSSLSLIQTFITSECRFGWINFVRMIRCFSYTKVSIIRTLLQVSFPSYIITRYCSSLTVRCSGKLKFHFINVIVMDTFKFFFLLFLKFRGTMLTILALNPLGDNLNRW